MIVKICGLTDKETAHKTAEAGADMIGFVFAPSSRRIAPIDAKRIAKSLPKETKKVGVFVDESVKNIHFIANLVGLDYVQLHGREQPEIAKQIRYPIIKAFTLTETDERTIKTYPCEYVLIDSPGKKYRGGSGETFDWSLFEQFTIDRERVILAGGLHAQNVKKAIQTLRPFAVDVSSGVETDGKKDISKIEQFIAQAKRSLHEHHVAK